MFTFCLSRVKGGMKLEAVTPHDIVMCLNYKPYTHGRNMPGRQGWVVRSRQTALQLGVDVLL